MSIYSSSGPLPVFRRLLRQMLLVLPLALCTGSLVAFFLWALDAVTRIRWRYPELLALLPLAGVLIALLYRLYGKDAVRGNNLIIEEIHRPGGGVPARMAPLVLFSTLITHLVGGSAGREGTGVQMGGAIAGWFGRRLRLDAEDLRMMLLAGMAAGFGAVFGTPVAGAVFALEVLAIGRIRYGALVPCFAAAVVADVVTAAWGIRHTHYAIAFHEVRRVIYGMVLPNGLLLLKSLAAGILFGLTARLFSVCYRAVHRAAARLDERRLYLAPLAGGLLLLLLSLLPGIDDYLGLGVQSAHPQGVSIVNAFGVSGIPPYAWLLKLLLTALTLGCGFKGGEVTPLFFIGATLGHSIALLTGAPADLFAGLGFIAVFAGAANTPLTCTLLGVELFGGEHLPYYAIVCFTAYSFSGSSGIYSAQRRADEVDTGNRVDKGNKVDRE